MSISLRNTRFYNDTDLLSYWEMEGNSTNSKDISITGSDTNVIYRTTSGRFNTGSLFDGSTSKIILSGNTASVQPTGPFTITTWAKTTDTGNYREIIGTVTQTGAYLAGYEFRKSGANNGLQFEVGNRTDLSAGSGYQQASSTSVINTGELFFLAGRYNGTNLQCFVNGLPDGASVAYTNNPVYETPVRNNQRIGCNNYIGSTEIQFWSGSIDDLAIFNRALSDAEILEIYKSSSMFVPTSSWYDSSWAHRKLINVSSSMAAADCFNFPLLVSMSDSSLANYAQSDGKDILFTDGDGITKLFHELEFYNAGNIVSWVSIPIVYNSASVNIYMYYGNPSAVSQQNSSSVWDSNFTGVYHLNSSSKDSTINANNGTYTNNVTYTGSMVASGAYFNGTDAFISSSVTPQNTITNWTIEGWINTNNTNQQGKAFHIGNPETGGGVDSGYALGIGNNAGGTGNRVEGLFSGIAFTGTSYSITANNWYYIVMTHDDLGLTYIYVNGGAAVGTGFATPKAPTFGFQIGREINVRYFDGIVDEVRFSTARRSEGWMKTTYLNIASSSIYVSAGSLESLLAPSITYSIKYVNKLEGIRKLKFN